MDIALQVPELVNSKELRSHIDEVRKSWNTIWNGIHGKCVRDWDSALFVSSAATTEYPVPAEAQGVTPGPHGPQRDDDGLHLAGRRWEPGWGTRYDYIMHLQQETTASVQNPILRVGDDNLASYVCRGESEEN